MANLFPIDQSRQRAKNALVALFQSGKEPWSAVLGDPIEIGDPVTVQRLDRVDSFYYLFPVNTPDINGSPAAASVDALTGTYKEAIALPTRSGIAFHMLPVNQALDKVVGHSFDLPDGSGTIHVRDGLYSLYPILVWEPCEESFSPFSPFYMIIVGAFRLFVGMDGEVHLGLNDDVAGY